MTLTFIFQKDSGRNLCSRELHRQNQQQSKRHCTTPFRYYDFKLYFSGNIRTQIDENWSHLSVLSFHMFATIFPQKNLFRPSCWSWLHSDYILSTFLLHSDIILTISDFFWLTDWLTDWLRGGGGWWSSRTFDLLLLMIIDLQRSIDLRWLFDPVLLFILRWSCWHLKFRSNSFFQCGF